MLTNLNYYQNQSEPKRPLEHQIRTELIEWHQNIVNIRSATCTH